MEMDSFGDRQEQNDNCWGGGCPVREEIIYGGNRVRRFKRKERRIDHWEDREVGNRRLGQDARNRLYKI